MDDSKREGILDGILSSVGLPAYTHPLTATAGIGPHHLDHFARFRAECAERTAAIRENLAKLATNELEKLAADPAALKHIETQHRLRTKPEWYTWGFSVRGFEPDWAYWTMLEMWTLEEATCLSIGFKPQAMPLAASTSRDKYQRGYFRPIEFYWQRLETVRRCGCLDPEQPEMVIAAKFVQWAANKRLPVPLALSGKADPKQRPALGMLKTVDARQYDSALKVILGLRASSCGDEDVDASPQTRDEVQRGLKKIGISLDPKTLKGVLAQVSKSRARFCAEQASRDG